jgi:hypothetical protein
MAGLQGQKCARRNDNKSTRRDTIQSGESTFVPFEAEPGEVGEDGLLGLPGGALEVGVLDAEHEASPLGACEEVVEERGACAADKLSSEF